MSYEIGRLVRTTKELCGECGTAHLQLRARKVDALVKGEILSEEQLYLYCPTCENEQEYKDKKLNKKKHREIKEVIEVKEVRKERDYGGRDKKRGYAPKSNDRGFKRSY